MPDGLKLTAPSTHLPVSHSLEALVCIRKKLIAKKEGRVSLHI